ncbi:conserved Plasmodium protein, unknown function [Plasmodium gallinaceum]|uniref:Uncharacterized protein n=1 Tax=Plasmodium gallinaceum TaxID=5849 RepID=A0A1J1GYX9_PLAGA|nr:conserved Plasmodium protein, unknown function [Plasmodium gallinaceum]CRG97669.1 conserved Plasmodium protein, unknown function [Plasmodium gallinaceum]
MNNTLIFLFLLINYGKNVYGATSNVKDPIDENDDPSNIDRRWMLYDLETNPYLDLKHPNFKGDFIRSIDEYYVYETKEYNMYKQTRYANMMNNTSFERKQFNCVISVLLHGRPNSREFYDYKIWSSQAAIIKDEVISKQKYGKFILYAPFISRLNFLGHGALHTHINFAYLVALRLTMTLKNISSDDTCYNYDVFLHAHCFGANILRFILSLSNDIWKIKDTSLLDLNSERTALAILEDNFKLTLRNIDIVTNKDSIKPNKDPYFRGPKYYLYKNFQVDLRHKELTESLDEIFNDENVNYNNLSDDMLQDTNINYIKSEDTENQINRVIKRFHFYLLNKKISLMNISATGPPLSGVVWNLEDIKIGHQKKLRYKSILKIVPSFVKNNITRTRDVEELMYITNPKLLCHLAVEEKVDYNYNKNRGSLISYFKNVNYYADLDNDELVSMYTSLGLHSPAHMRSLSYFMLNFRNEFYNRIFKIPVHLSNINVSDNNYFISYLEENDVCSYVKNKYLEYFVSYVNELVNYNQKPSPYIPQRYAYKNPFLVHFKVPVDQKNNIYTSHSILGTGRTALLLYSYELYKHLSSSGLNNNDVIRGESEYFYDTYPFVYYNWMTYIANQKDRKKENIMKDVLLYSDNVNMDIVDNLFNVFTIFHYLKFFIFHNNAEDAKKNIYKMINQFSLPNLNNIFKKKEKKKIEFSMLKRNELNKQEKYLYDFFGIYTNFLKNFSNNNAFSYIPDDVFLIKHSTFKDHHNKNIDSLKEQIKNIHDFVKENKTFYEMKKKLNLMYNIDRTDNIVDDDEDIEELYKEFESYNDIQNLDIDNNNEDFNNSDKGTVNNYYGMYFHIKRILNLKDAFVNIKQVNSSYKNVQYVEFVIKNAKYENIEDNLNNLENNNYCLFNYDEEIDLSYIVHFCNYNQQIYYNLYKRYTSNSIYVLEKLSDCELDNYKYLKLCENAILLKRFFHKELDVILSEVHKKELRKMYEMRTSIERGINARNIFSLSNDSLVAVLHNKNENMTNIKINVCFKVSDVSKNKNLFFKDKLPEPEYDFKDNVNSMNNSVFCTHVSLPVKINTRLIKSLNDIYLRAIRYISKDKHFQSIFNITEDEGSYKSFVYFFDKFSYVYDLRSTYKNSEEITSFTTPQNFTWKYFYYLLKYDINTEFNNEEFLHNFFYEEDNETVKPLNGNIFEDFLMHFTAFFYIFKVN